MFSIVEAFVKYILDAGNTFSREVTVVLLSMLPISELRGAIPVSMLYYGIAPLTSFFLCCIGNMIHVIPLLLFFRHAEALLSKTALTNKMLTWYLQHVRSRAASVERYETWGLAIFVAIPLPATGAWTGSIVAFLLGIKFQKALWSIGVGVGIAGIIVTLLTMAGYKVYSFL